MITTNMLTYTDTTVITATEPTTVVTMWLCNNHSTDVDFIDIYIVPSGAARSATNRIYRRLSIEPEDTYIIDMERIMLSTGDRVVVTATNDEYTSCVISAMEGV